MRLPNLGILQWLPLLAEERIPYEFITGVVSLLALKRLGSWNRIDATFTSR